MSSRAKKRKTRESRNQQQYALENKLCFEFNSILPLTKNQEHVFNTFHKKDMFLYGCAGTGKSFLAVYLALREIFNPSSPYKKLIIVRSQVQTRDSGHMPGNDKEKQKYYEIPYTPICADIFGRGDAYLVLKQKGLVEFITTQFIRGITVKDAIVLVDECQSMTGHELDSVITRVGDNCKIIFAGDLRQNDLQHKRNDKTGLPDFLEIIRAMNCFEFVEFQEADIVRSNKVKNYIITRNRLEDNGTIQPHI